jgi:hypothetical protein
MSDLPKRINTESSFKLKTMATNPNAGVSCVFNVCMKTLRAKQEPKHLARALKAENDLSKDHSHKTMDTNLRLKWTALPLQTTLSWLHRCSSPAISFFEARRAMIYMANDVPSRKVPMSAN